MNWSDASSNCRLEWRPSRWMIALLAALTVAACVALHASYLPPRIALGAEAVAALYGIGLVAVELRKPRVSLAWSGGGAPWQVVHGERVEPLAHVAAGFRGGLVVLTVRDEASGRSRRFVWWPDTLDVSARRSLRLAASAAVERGNATARADA